MVGKRGGFWFYDGDVMVKLDLIIKSVGFTYKIGVNGWLHVKFPSHIIFTVFVLCCASAFIVYEYT